MLREKAAQCLQTRVEKCNYSTRWKMQPESSMIWSGLSPFPSPCLSHAKPPLFLLRECRGIRETGWLRNAPRPTWKQVRDGAASSGPCLLRSSGASSLVGGAVVSFAHDVGLEYRGPPSGRRRIRTDVVEVEVVQVEDARADNTRHGAARAVKVPIRRESSS